MVLTTAHVRLACCRYKCSNPRCSEVMARAKNAGVTLKLRARHTERVADLKLAEKYAVHFRSTSPAQMASYPEIVRSRYGFTLLEKGGYSDALGDSLLTSCAKMMQKASHVSEAYGRRRMRLCGEYADWCQKELRFQGKRLACAVLPTSAAHKVDNTMFPAWVSVPVRLLGSNRDTYISVYSRK